MGYDGLMLSTAGLERMNLVDLITHQCDPTVFVPAPGQGIIAIQTRTEDHYIQNLIEAVTQPEINALGYKYYRILEMIQFNCGIPFGAYFDSNDDLWVFFEKNGRSVSHLFSHELENQIDDAIQFIKGYGE